MAAKEQLTAMEMIWGFMSGTTGHMGKTDFAPQKEAFGDFASPETYFPRVVPESEGISSEKLETEVGAVANICNLSKQQTKNRPASLLGGF